MILDTDNIALLESVKDIFRNEIKSDFWDSLSSGQKEEIELSLQEFKNGETVDYDEFIKKLKS